MASRRKRAISSQPRRRNRAHGISVRGECACPMRDHFFTGPSLEQRDALFEYRLLLAERSLTHSVEPEHRARMGMQLQIMAPFVDQPRRRTNHILPALCNFINVQEKRAARLLLLQQIHDPFDPEIARVSWNHARDILTGIVVSPGLDIHGEYEFCLHDLGKLSVNRSGLEDASRLSLSVLQPRDSFAFGYALEQLAQHVPAFPGHPVVNYVSGPRDQRRLPSQPC